ncbi:hypothetical protein [Paraliobacillus ryukyuensis]|uniref:hypothetical protein n=1 Tax=Paraliobacillus ryukyuensis TaxID=200904 RepID=UPI0009A8E486|nr:hypothetical protein [Paraliobacillus ryukyuensis]
MSAPGLQYGIKEVLDFLLRDFATKEPITLIDYATATSNETSAERIDINGGRGMPKLMSFDHTKVSTFTLTLPLVDLKTLAMLAGSELINDTTKELIKTEKVTVTDNGGTLEATLTKEPINGDVALYVVDGQRDFGEEITGATVATSTITFGSETPTVSDGQEVWAIYQYAAPAGAKQIRITSTNFPKAVEMSGYGIWRNQLDETDYPVHVQVHKARPQSNFTFTMEGENATNLELTFDVYEATIDGEKTYIDYIVMDDPDA